MKLLKPATTFLIAACILIGIGGCDRERTGTATFYFDQNGPNATVNVNGESANITANYQGLPPVCGTGASGCANFVLPVGTYNYVASSSLTSWSGSITVTTDGCTETDLTQSTGAVTFWTANPNYGTITVNINGTSGNINGYFTGGTPLCGASGAATFDLSPGTYSYTASSTTGSTWGPTTITVTTDGCQPIQFTP